MKTDVELNMKLQTMKTPSYEETLSLCVPLCLRVLVVQNSKRWKKTRKAMP